MSDPARGPVFAPVLQRHAAPAGPRTAPTIAHDVLGSPGRSLEPGLRGGTEARFGHDFSAVRVHTSEPAAASTGPILQRKVVVNPPAAATQIESHLRTFCAANVSHSSAGELSEVGCGVVKADEACNCVCDVVDDPNREYTINVAKSTVSMKPQKLWDGSTVPVPEASLFPATTPDDDPVVNFPDTGSDIELGSFDAKGKPRWAPLWRVLAHELCGHGRLKQSYVGQTGDRAGHDSTIDTENTIASALGEPLRGHYADPRQGESFFNKKGDPKVVFKLIDGLHYEVP
jgi:hypothetical protein